MGGEVAMKYVTWAAWDAPILWPNGEMGFWVARAKA